MTQDESNQVEDHLLSWYRWQRAYQVNLGNSRCDPMFRDCIIPSTSMTDRERAEVSDAKIWKRNSEIIEMLVDQLTWQLRAAIQTSLRNKTVGASVWSNPRLSSEETHYYYQAAKAQLFPQFVARGLIKIVEVVA